MDMNRQNLNKPQPVAHKHFKNGDSNIFPMFIKPGSKVYRYDVEILCGEKSLFKSSDDGRKALNRRLCHEIMRALSNKYNFQDLNWKKINIPLNPFVYDCGKILFVKYDLKFTERDFAIEKDELKEEIGVFLPKKTINVTIKKCDNNILKLDDFKPSLFNDLGDQTDHSLRTFLEILTSQPFLNIETHDVIGAGKIYSRAHSQSLSDFAITRKGCKKGVRIITNNNKPCPALVVDVVESLFYKDCSLIQIMNEWGKNNREELAQNIKGLRFYLKHAPHRSFLIHGFSNNKMKNIVLNGISFETFYNTKYKNLLKDANLNEFAIKTFVKNKEGKEEENHFPPSQVVIIPSQKVPLNKMKSSWHDRLIKINSTLPSIRYRAIIEQVQAIDRIFLQQFGVDIQIDPSKIMIGQRLLPNYNFSDSLLDSNNKYKLDNEKFIMAAQINKWLFCYKTLMNKRAAIESKSDKFCRPSVDKDYQGILREAKKFGVSITEPMVYRFNENQAPILKLFDFAKQNKCNFLVLYDEENDKTHNLLKLYEQKEQILTQHIVYETVHRAGSATFKNIALKLNMKNFGLNYQPTFTIKKDSIKKLDLNSNRVLVFSYDVSHPAPASPFLLYKAKKEHSADKDLRSLEPSVVGFCANMTKNAYHFVGDYFYQLSRKESLDTILLKEKVQSAIVNTMANRPGFEPKAVFIIRDGLSEGQYEMAYRDELPAIKGALNSFKFGFTPKVVFIIVTKRHNKRFFVLNRKDVQNINNCSVIDDKIVRPDVHEFFMASYYSRIGTAKPPQYTVICNEISLPGDYVEEFMNFLCHLNQISLGGISLPGPVHQAHELAKRGRNNYIAEYKKVNIDFNPNFNLLNQKMVYENKPLALVRFNA